MSELKISIQTENEEEEKIFGQKKVEYENVKEFFVCGLRIVNLIELNEFRHWSGTYPYLIGKLYYYLKQLEREESKI